jgi:hypothetical protein
MQAQCTFAMARYRIIQRPHPQPPGDLVYEVEQWEQMFLGLRSWAYIGRFDQLEHAQQYMKEMASVYRVVEEYN